MSKFTFVCQEESMPFVHSIQSKRTVEFNAETLDDILNEFEMFLRGAGFHFEGHLDFVNEDEWNEDNDGVEEFQTPQNLYDEMDYGVSHTPKNTKPWDWTVGELMKGPITMHDMGGSFEVNTPSYGAAQPTIAFPPGVDTITITGKPEGSWKCELCGIPKTVMEKQNCYDDNCPKGTW